MTGILSSHTPMRYPARWTHQTTLSKNQTQEAKATPSYMRQRTVCFEQLQSQCTIIIFIVRAETGLPLHGEAGPKGFCRLKGIREVCLRSPPKAWENLLPGRRTKEATKCHQRSTPKHPHEHKPLAYKQRTLYSRASTGLVCVSVTGLRTFFPEIPCRTSTVFPALCRR